MKIARFRQFLLAASLISEVSFGLEQITISAPGPRNLSYLPIDLIPRIGADREEDAHLRILHVGGGAVALEDLASGNAEFASAGVPATLSFHIGQGNIVLIAAVDDAPMFVLMVRSDLKNQVKRIADLKGKIVGVNTSTSKSKTTSQQLLELLLASEGVSPEEVRIISAGQNWITQSSLILSDSVDALLGDEPFASRLRSEEKVFFLANLSETETMKNIPGVHFLHAALETRSEVIQETPKKVEKMVRMLQKSLAWIHAHTPEELITVLEIQDPEERKALVSCLKKYPNAFSKDGSFSTEQLKQTDLFFGAGRSFPTKVPTAESITDPRWAGFHP